MAGYGAGAAAGLQDVLKQLFLEAQQKQHVRAQQQDFEQRRMVDADAGQRWQQDHELRRQAFDRLTEQDRLKAAADAAATAARQSALDPILNDPTIPLPARNLLKLGQHGMGANLNVHQLEPPDVHAGHVRAEATADADREFAAWKRQQDYTRQHRPAVAGRLVKVDPAFPAGVQSHVAQIRARHGDFESALGEFVNSIPLHQQAHPNFQPQKAIAALQAMYAGGGRPVSTSDEAVTGLVRDVMGGGAMSGTGRASGLGARPSAVPADGGQAVTLAELQALAQRRGTSVEAERARATAAGYVVR